MTWHDFRTSDGKLLCRFAPVVGLLWFRQRGEDTFIDIRPFLHAMLLEKSESA